MEKDNVEMLEKWSLRTGILGLTLFIPFSLFIQDLPYLYQLIPFFISMVFLGLPHGAMDHLVPSRLSSMTTGKSIAAVTILYTFIGGLYTIWWFIEPFTAMLFFIAMTWVHWGQGDLYAITELGKGDHLIGKTDKALSLLVRGGIPMLVPLIAYPELYERFLSSILQLFSTNVDLSPFFTQTSITFTGLFIGGLTLSSALLGGLRVYRGASLRSWLYDQGEVAFLWIYFILLPPIFAVGLYFCLWHSLRHIARLSVIEDSEMLKNLEDGEYVPYVKNLIRDTGPLTILALIVIGSLTVMMPGYVEGAESVIAGYLVGIAVLTLPHFIVVSWMDYRQRVWTDN